MEHAENNDVTPENIIQRLCVNFETLRDVYRRKKDEEELSLEETSFCWLPIIETVHSVITENPKHFSTYDEKIAILVKRAAKRSGFLQVYCRSREYNPVLAQTLIHKRLRSSIRTLLTE